MADDETQQHGQQVPMETPKPAKGPGVFSRAGTGMRRAWRGYRAYRLEQANIQARAQQAVPAPTASTRADQDQQPSGLQVTEEMDHLERFKLSFARGWFIIAALFLAGVAGWSVGYTFSGLHPFSFSDQETLAAYAGSFALEGIFTGCMFVVTINRHRGRSWALVFVAAIALALISVLAQFAGYEAMYQAGRIQVSDTAIDQIPILSWLVGSMQGHSILFLARGLSFHLAEIVACLCMPSKHLTVEEQVSKQMTRQLHRHLYALAEQSYQIQAALAEENRANILRKLQAGGLVVEAKPGEQGNTFRIPANSSNGAH